MSQQASASIKPREVSYTSLKHLLARRNENSHKGNFGHVLVVGGDHGFGGAALMAAVAAARTGAGLVSVATRPEHVSACLARHPELMVRGIETPEHFEPLIKSATVIIIGPGLGQSAWSRSCLQSIFESPQAKSVPLVVDADALNLISQGALKNLTADSYKWVLTPHTGEAARLLELSNEEVKANREQSCLNLQARYGGACILKGAGTLVAYRQSGRLQLDRCQHGNPGMATGGMGDILSGVLGGLLAQGFSLIDSIRLGVCIHSLAADQVAKDTGERGLLATDLLPYIHSLVNN